ncbi:protein-glutamate methylesterase/protein-glutamine glutaminase [Thiosocius teredinicola]|uniref:protein-glutamate methylesterase/protein-glutamine glutaminase n=1 Tax=Thiosocius teredinicola TaxID=1973002 RepID=UPI000990C10E
MVGKVRVLVVDDSSFFRKRIKQELERHGDIVVVGEASNGREAVEMASRLHPDLITMDVAMPLMDGIAAVREIMRTHPTNIIMFSALTRDGAKSTLEALEAGAVDFLAKQGGIGVGNGNASSTLAERVISIARSNRSRHHMAVATNVAPVPTRPLPAAPPPRNVERRRAAVRLVVIGASTGGPVAIQQVLNELPANYPYPVLVAVHMPAEFSATFAERLDHVCRIGIAQASNGDELSPGRVLIAPGGMQTTVDAQGGRLRVRVSPGGEHLYKPSVDIMFDSAARALNKGVQAVVLTGMGSDGTEGARALKGAGATVWSQDQATSVVYGMPYSVAKAGLTDRVLPLEQIGSALAGLA